MNWTLNRRSSSAHNQFILFWTEAPAVQLVQFQQSFEAETYPKKPGKSDKISTKIFKKQCFKKFSPKRCKCNFSTLISLIKCSSNTDNERFTRLSKFFLVLKLLLSSVKNSTDELTSVEFSKKALNWTLNELINWTWAPVQFRVEKSG